MNAFIPDIVSTYLLLFESHFTKPSFRYFCGYILGLLLAGGRKTTTEIAHTCFFVDRHLASWQRFLAENRWDSNAVIATLVETVTAHAYDALLVHGAYLAALDTCLIAKNGTKMIGLQEWHDHSGNADRGESIRGHHWALLGLLGFAPEWERYRCFPVLMNLVPGQLNPFQFVVDSDGNARRATFWDGVLPLIWQLQSHLQAPLRIVADAYFAKAPFLQPLLDHGIDAVVRMRKDAVGWDDAASVGKQNGKWKLITLLDLLAPEHVPVHIYGRDVTVTAVCRSVWLRNLKQRVKVVVVAGKDKRFLLLSTDETLTMAQIIEIYAARFSIELAIRDMKTHFGLADYQCYLTTAIYRFVHIVCVAHSLFRLIQFVEDIDDWMPDASRSISTFSFTRIRNGLQRYLIGKILSPTFGKIPKSDGCDTELDAILRIAA